ncbi:MAG: hypothetical protein M9927_21435 [Anaerolineae bacterium]|nr:hypothetical protein [Anaerolineae bacterium]
MEIRPVSEQAEYLATERLQSEVWNLPDVEIVPLHVLVTAAKNGGLLLGAFDGDRLAGFVFGFPGLTADGRLKHCSHMAGVHPDYRDQNLGYRLKLAQREVVLSQGIDLITWTFDPLEARNAWLNFHKLGAVCNTYLRNVYGDMRDGLNAGLPSDRLQVEWWIGGAWVERRLRGEGTIHPPPAPPSEGGGPEAGGEEVAREDDPPSSNSSLRGRRAGSDPLSLWETAKRGVRGDRPLIAIPASFQAIKSADMDLARQWRIETRRLFEDAFRGLPSLMSVTQAISSVTFFSSRSATTLPNYRTT